MQTISWKRACGCLGLAMGLAVPRPAPAGEREWATVGKILTGVAVAGVLHHALSSPASGAPVSYSVEFRQAVAVGRPHPARGYTHRHSRTIPPRPSSAYRPAPRQGVHYRAHPPRSSWGCEPITVPLGPHRRLYQPRISGHPAYVQEWRGARWGWVTVRHHPSIW